MTDDSGRLAYEKVDLPFEVGELVINTRLKAGLSQEQLAEKAGTKQPAIARLEKGDKLPGLGFLQRIAEAMGYEIKIDFEQIKKTQTGTYQKLAQMIPEGAYLGCQICSSQMELTDHNKAGFLAVGWPKCCGHTMRLITESQSSQKEAP